MAETGFMIDGTVYEMPSRDTFTMDEWQVMYDLAGAGMTDFSPLGPDATDEEREQRVRLFKNPSILRALMTIAYQRGNPDVPAKDVAKLISGANAYDALETLADDDEEASEEVPLDTTSDPAQSSPTRSLESVPTPSSSTATSSESSSNDSDRLAAVPASTTA